jgi:hypothetical protein
MWSRGYSAIETKAAFTRAQELAAGIDDSTERFTAYYGLWLGTFLRGELGMAREMAEAFVAGANHGEKITQAVALAGGALRRRLRVSLGLTCFCQGDFAAAQSHLEEALSIFDRERDREAGLRFADTAATAAVYLAHTSRVLGEVARARELMEQGVARAVECAHVPTLVNTCYFQALFEIFRGDAESAWRISEAVVGLSQKHGFALFLALGALCRGWARARLGDRAGGATELRGALTAYTELGDGGLPMTPALQEHPGSEGVVPWLRRLYALFISARQRQADARVAAHLRDLPDDVIRKLGVSVEAVEATLSVREHRLKPHCVHSLSKRRDRHSTLAQTAHPHPMWWLVLKHRRALHFFRRSGQC